MQRPVNQHYSSKTIFLASANRPHKQSNRPDHQINKPHRSALTGGKSPLSPPQYPHQAQSQRPYASSTQNKTFPYNKRWSPNANEYPASAITTNSSRVSCNDKYSSSGSKGPELSKQYKPQSNTQRFKAFSNANILARIINDIHVFSFVRTDISIATIVSQL